jgi:ketosteroid isomerase-like protein
MARAEDVVRQWHAALNEGDLERLVGLSAEDVLVGGPRGTGRGTQLLREWFGRAGVRLVPRAVYPDGDTVVVDQLASWGPDAEPAPVASVFAVNSEGKVSRVLRYDTLDQAKDAAKRA